MFEFFSTREVVSGLYLSLIVALALLKQKHITPLTNLIKAACKKIFIIPILCLLAYAGLIVYAIQALPFWDWILIKDVLFWVLFVATPICFKASVNREKNQYPFKQMVKDNFVWSAILEFFISAFTFPFLSEMVVVPVFSLLLLLQNYNRDNKRYQDVHKLIDRIVVVMGLILFVFTVKTAIEIIELNGIKDVLISFCIPIILSIAFLPIVYILAVKGKYHDLFVRIKIQNNKGTKVLNIKKKAVIRACGLSYKRLCEFERAYYSIYILSILTGSDKDTLLSFIQAFKRGELTFK